jgi:hypothetical protein
VIASHLFPLVGTDLQSTCQSTAPANCKQQEKLHTDVAFVWLLATKVASAPNTAVAGAERELNHVPEPAAHAQIIADMLCCTDQVSHVAHFK